MYAASHTPDRYTEIANRAQARLREDFKELHVIAVALGAEMREKCAPPDVRSNMGKIIDQTALGTAGIGAPTPDAPPELAALERCVAKVLRPIERAVFDCEYVWCFGCDMSVRLRWLQQRRGVRVTRTQYKHKLMVMRERLLAAFQIAFENIL